MQQSMHKALAFVPIRQEFDQKIRLIVMSVDMGRSSFISSRALANEVAGDALTLLL